MPFFSKTSSPANNTVDLAVDTYTRGHGNGSGNGSGNNLSLLSPKTDVNLSLFSTHVHQSIHVQGEKPGASSTTTALIGAGAAAAVLAAGAVIKYISSSEEDKKALKGSGNKDGAEDGECEGVDDLYIVCGNGNQYDNTLATQMMRERLRY
ncbi:hypothetical protein V8F20_004357 [Naviculisporaceae sp. PSN 640]